MPSSTVRRVSVIAGTDHGKSLVIAKCLVIFKTDYKVMFSMRSMRRKKNIVASHISKLAR